MAPLLLLQLLLPIQLVLAAVADALPDSCAKATCAGHDIHYPFWLNSSTPNCVYPAGISIGLICQDNSTLILPIKTHRYIVLSIDYKTHTVLVSDADIADEYAAGGCPRLHVNLTIDTAWLWLAPSDSNITFLYSCKKNITLSSAVELSGCQQQLEYGNRSYVLRDGGITGAEAYEYECEEVVVAPVLDAHKKAIVGASGAPPPGNGSFHEVLQGGFELNYDTHNHQCDRCEGSGGWCGYQRDDTHAAGMKFTCFCESGPTTDRCAHASGRSRLFYCTRSQPKDLIRRA
ncbi:hypothetical protein BDA96_03G284700 [Sorghum bicolor]|uniref:Wall-associated receptor kinase galacturonan-binding domain-containing protein n=1 Tax=Sorghum bicolor TaxID=4558 RepID=A0A921RF70_SORBI|nr:hypothetical protein BDA96_03G284700 [Sorghum bicolor]